MVVKATIKSELKTLYARCKSSELSDDDFADAMADIIRNAVISGTVTVAAGIATAVSTSTGIGATTATGTGTIS